MCYFLKLITNYFLQKVLVTHFYELTFLILSNIMLSIIAQLLSTAVRGAQSASSVAVESTRPKRLINPSPVRHGFIPEEWFQAFYPKTGASGK